MLLLLHFTSNRCKFSLTDLQLMISSASVEEEEKVLTVVV